MNRERYTRSRQPAQRLDKRPQRPAAPSPKRLVGDIITYQDSTGRDLEADEDDYDDAWPPRLPSSAINYQKRAADVQTEDYPRVGKKLVVPSNLPPGVVLIRGIPCANVGGAWMKVALHDGPPPGAGASPQRQAQDRQTEEHVLDRQPSRRRVLPRVHWLVFVGSAFLLMVGGWVLFNSLTSWLQGKVDDARY